MSGVKSLNEVNVTDFDADQSIEKLISQGVATGNYNKMSPADLSAIFNLIK